MKSGVYTITCKATGRTYVGCSVDTARRIRSHYAQLRAGTHYNRLLQSEFDLFGQGSFSDNSFPYPVDDMYQQEKEGISHYKCLDLSYNVSAGLVNTSIAVSYPDWQRDNWRKKKGLPAIATPAKSVRRLRSQQK